MLKTAAHHLGLKRLGGERRETFAPRELVELGV